MLLDDGDGAATDLILDPVTIGDVYRFQVTVGDQNGVPIQADGASFDFGYGVQPGRCARENVGKPSASPALGTTTVNGVSFFTANVGIPPAETALLSADTSYFWAVRMTLNGDPQVIASGTFPVVSCPL